MLIEMRRYHVLPGRMDDMHSRMTELLLPLFPQHDIPTPFAIWEDREGASILTWMLEWRSFEHRQSAWLNFAPIWTAGRQKRGGDEFVTRTDLTLIQPWPGYSPEFGAGVGACETAWLVQPRVGFGAQFNSSLVDTDFALFREAGAQKITAFNFIFGPLPQALLILSWPDAQKRLAGLEWLSRRELPAALATAVAGDGSSPTSRARWESLNRVPYAFG